MNYERVRTGKIVSRLIPVLLLLACALVVTAVTRTVGAQEVTAAVLGRVVDQNDAPIANARISATDESRGTAWTTESNSDGVFNLPRLPVGVYEIRVEASGFKAWVRTKFQLVLNQTARVDVKMEVGEITQTTEVTAAAPVLQTDTTQLGTVIDSRTNVALPLATRNYIQLTLLAPGSLNPNPPTLTNGDQDQRRTALRQRQSRAGQQFPSGWPG